MKDDSGIVEQLRTSLAEALKYGAPENATAHRRKVKCDHNDYWVTMSGDCLACRAVKAETSLAAVEKLMAKIAKQRTVEEWEQFAKDEGLDPDNADYTGAYDAIVREARAALAGPAATRGGDGT